MNTIMDVLQNKKPRDVILFLTRKRIGISYPQLDRIYNRSGWVHVNDNLGLMKIVQKMIDEELLISDGGNISKGARWNEPQFMTEKKYTFEKQS